MNTETLFEGKHLRVVCRGSWEFVERTTARAVVVILAVTNDDEVLLVEQERLPVDSRVIELPAGLVGDSECATGEPLETAARRELLEETGYEAGSIGVLFSGPPSAGLSSEIITFCRASELKYVHQGGGVDNENIVLHKVPRNRVASWLSQRKKEGVMIDPKIFAALFWL